jgi:hypothetical protein
MSRQQELIVILQDIAESYQPKLEAKLRAKLNKREQSVLDWLLLLYQDEAKRRWFDPFHILFSTNFAIDLIENEKLSRLIVPGILLHDIGYFAIEDKINWSSYESRIIHMQEGTVLAARILCENGYTPKELEMILGMISVHDNPYIGIEIKGRDRLGLRDCDRVWVMHMLSFYKDLASKPERFQNPTEFLYDRITQFYGWKHPFGADKAITVNRVKKNASRIEIPTFSFTRNYVKTQFESRINEQQYIESSNTNEFTHYLFTQIQKE